jgi:hypothetical protein
MLNACPALPLAESPCSTGTDAERLYVAVICKRACEQSEHLMVTDKRGRIAYATSKVCASRSAALARHACLGQPHTC